MPCGTCPAGICTVQGAWLSLPLQVHGMFLLQALGRCVVHLDWMPRGCRACLLSQGEKGALRGRRTGRGVGIRGDRGHVSLDDLELHVGCRGEVTSPQSLSSHTSQGQNLHKGEDFS